MLRTREKRMAIPDPRSKPGRLASAFLMTVFPGEHDADATRGNQEFSGLRCGQGQPSL